MTSLNSLPKHKRRWLLRVVSDSRLSPDAVLAAIAAAFVSNRRGEFSDDEIDPWLAENMDTVVAVLTELTAAGRPH